MRFALTPHPDGLAPAISIEAEAERVNARLKLTFRLAGDLQGLRIPPPGAPGRADQLWRHTCFEAFVAPALGDPYYEANVAPSGAWATYRFDGYRRGMAPADAEITLREVDAGRRELILHADVALDMAAELSGAWRVGLTAVIEAADGSLSYWSLAHPPGRPDFHHADCFALEVPAPQGS